MAARSLPRRVLPALLVLLAACGGDTGSDTGSGAPAAATAPPRWNVLLISIDTLRADHLSAYGYDRATSPHIDRLAHRGLRFEHATAQAPCTSPSHMSLMTSLYPEAHGVRQWNVSGNRRLAADVPTLASVLSGADWATEAYTGGGNVRPELGFDQGFDVYATDGGRPEVIFDKAETALRRLGAAPDGRPFLLFVHTFDVHDPYLPPEALIDHFADQPYTGKIVGSAHELAALSGFDRTRRDEIFWSLVDTSDRRDIARLEELYDACILHVDGLVGRLLGALRDQGLDRRTLVVFTADHGEEFGEHGSFRHLQTYQEVLHVPLIMAFPTDMTDAPAPGVHTGIVRLIDVLPTLCDLLHLEPPPLAQGRSLVPLLGADRDVDSAIFSQWMRGGQHALREDGWKLMLRYRDGQEVPDQALFDLARDPGERFNVIEEFPDVAQTLRGHLQALRAVSRQRHEQLGSGGDVTLDPETRAQLEELGYLGH